MKPINLQGYDLLHQGTLALSEIEQKGICVDMEYCNRKKKRLEFHIDLLEKQIETDEVVQTWKEVYEDEFKLNSSMQLQNILYNHLNLPKYDQTPTGRGKVDEEALSKHSDLPFVDKYLNIKKLKHALNTYLIPLIEEIDEDGLLHSFFDLGDPITYRGSSSKINFQNIPKHNPKLKDIIWKAIIPPKDQMLLFIDFSGVEVRGGCCYHKDPVMIKDVLDPKRDMHRDAACEILKMKPNEINKTMRFLAKNNFVFAQFYGDYYVNCAKNFWQGIDDNDARTNDNIPLKEYLCDIGLGDLNSFTDHMQDVEKWLWNKKFKEYRKWKNRIWEQYLNDMYIDTKTGFRLQGLMSKNDVTNYPIQGSSFHILLWCLIYLHDMFKQMKLKSRIFGQIHDCLCIYLHPDEYNLVIDICFRMMTIGVRKYYKWIDIPLEVEAEVARINEDATQLQEIHPFDCPVCGSKYSFRDKIENYHKYECPLCNNIEERVAA